MSTIGNASRDKMLAVALASGATREEAGRVAGVSARTVSRRLADTEFTATVHAARSEAYERAVGVLSASAVEAARVLCDLLGPTNPPGVRLAAARAALEAAVRFRELFELELRISALEQSNRG